MINTDARIMLDISRAKEFRRLLEGTLKRAVCDAVDGTESIHNVNDLLVDMLLDLAPKMNTPEQVRAAVVDYVIDKYAETQKTFL